MKIVSLFIFLIYTVSISAQSFWKISGVETDENALHSGIIYSNDPEAIFVSTYNMGIFRSTNQGASWDHVLDLPKDQPVTTLFISENGTLLGGGTGWIYRNEANSDKWDEIPIDLPYIRSFAEDRNGYLYACSPVSGGIFRSADNGKSWTSATNGLPSGYVNNIIADGQGNLFCTLQQDDNGLNGGLWLWDENQALWVKKEIKVILDNTEYVMKVAQILDIDFNNDSGIIISLDGVATNFQVGGLFRNTVTGAIAETAWQQETWSDTDPFPFSLIIHSIFAASRGHIFASRISGSTAGIYTRMAYSKRWISSNEGIPPTANVNGYFCESREGRVFLTTDFSNKLLVTNESEPGKEYFKINFQSLQPMKLYEYQTLNATSGSGLDVSFISMDDRTYIEGNQLRATGLGTALIKAYTDGNESTYFSVENMTVSISKAENTIILDDPGIITEGDNPIYLSAASDSGEEVFFKVMAGNAFFEKNRLIYSSPGKVTFIATETGNDTYEEADTVWMEICINPKKPVIMADTISGVVRLVSSNDNNNRWYVNDTFSGQTGNTLYPGINGIYTLQVVADGCPSEPSEQYVYVITGIDPVSEKEVLVYPVPFRDKLSIRLSAMGSPAAKNQYRIADMTGKALMIGEFEGDHIILDLESLEPGSYILNVTRNQASEYFKIVKRL
ncbi:MAG: T9SS type A sorting domain-containing protein [Bacteroidales bacterium]|nr:T9SS type A sorting domain-containing protein [Bacteroidales bacterium]